MIISGITAGLRWHKSSHSGTAGNCVELASFPSGQVAVRDGKNPAGPILILDPTKWRDLRAAARMGRLDRC